MKQLILILLAGAALTACNKEPGLGGTSTIEGKVYKIETNVLGQILAEYYEADRDVYILYGDDDEIYDDKFATSYEGSYQFTNLLPGKYTVFAYSRCDACASGDTIVSQTVDITEKGTTYTLEDLVIYK
ncbi:hypothetical protein K6119_12400 [Paracrocinitomix mangrovi]|uniref:hypothetical protein n=1 Tax=Paracrocinitomix mangrovi TaxID=2862509 RepID=UPI001C8E65CF|nr:hypothetical protein [Paracrocinitomix mangrovi]UKN00533.1 hypothetical protein K6119_12400 [Paracrocinitomix mangrovi]